MTRCRFCKKPMQQTYARYEPRDGRIVQAEVQYQCNCGSRVTITDPQLRTMSRSEAPTIQ